jgi:hypothetical protein
MISTEENLRTRKETYASDTFTTNSTWADPGANPGLRGEKLAIYRLSHGTAGL